MKYAGPFRGRRLQLRVRNMQNYDWEMIREIYMEGILTSNATFEKNVPEWDVWNNNHLQSCRLVAREENCIYGWVALSPISNRCVYSGVTELSIYVSTQSRGKGIGKLLLKALIRESEVNGIWTIQAGVFPENTANIHLLKSCGFREIDTESD